jgi:membrane protein YdbS with pleckstrin-like domain
MTDPQASHHREHHLRTPTSELPHEQKIRRQERHLQILTGVMILVLAMLVYASIFDLDSWSEWVVFGAICAVAVGTIIAVNTRE